VAFYFWIGWHFISGLGGIFHRNMQKHGVMKFDEQLFGNDDKKASVVSHKFCHVYWQYNS
jgi:hypothetical protein